MPFSLLQLIFPLCENSVGLKVILHTGAVQNVLSISQGASERKQITLALTETCGHHAIIAVIEFMRKWYGKLQLKVSMRH